MGPELEISKELHASKYRSEGETFEDSMNRIASALTESEKEFRDFKDTLLNQRFLPGGRIQAAIGSPRQVTAYNCFLSGEIKDDMHSIMDMAKEATLTMRTGGGIGYDFSNLRPRGDWISTLDSHSSGPISFMDIYNSCCHTISSAGHRRGAQMGVLRVDHPDIEDFITAKHDTQTLTAFNISVAVTDEFMNAVENGNSFDLKFNNKIYKTVEARYLWDLIMRSTYDWAEPGVLFIDRINQMNNLWYCEKISATNPCAEQPLPPYGACLLGSFNLTKYVRAIEYYPLNKDLNYIKFRFDWDKFKKDIPIVIRAMDRVIDVTRYPLLKQEDEAKAKRRMGIGITGLANTLEALGYEYGTDDFIAYMEVILRVLRDIAYRTSVDLAVERGPFPYFDKNKYPIGEFISTLPSELINDIYNYGIRNSHLLSIAPTGTISLIADNVSSGIEPTFASYTNRVIQEFNGPRIERIEDYGVRKFGISPKTANQVSARDHVSVLCAAQRYIDSAVSKTINVPTEQSWAQFKELYLQAYRGGAKGCTTFRDGGKRTGILEDSLVCMIDPETGVRSCDE